MAGYGARTRAVNWGWRVPLGTSLIHSAMGVADVGRPGRVGRAYSPESTRGSAMMPPFCSMWASAGSLAWHE